MTRYFTVNELIATKEDAAMMAGGTKEDAKTKAEKMEPIETSIWSDFELVVGEGVNKKTIKIIGPIAFSI